MPKIITWQHEFMAIFVIGINHKTAPVDLREKIYFALDKLGLYLNDLLSTAEVSEAVLMSTCNRSELYCYAESVVGAKQWFLKQTQLSEEELAACLYVYEDEEALAHIMQVACGLDSMILGEPQILGQMKEAFAESCTAGAVGTFFNKVFQQIFAVAKEIRTTTAIGACPVSVASAAVHFAKQQVNLMDARVALIGAGDTTELLLRYLKTHLTQPVMIINRHREKANLLAETYGGEVYEWPRLEMALTKADVVFSATGSLNPIVSQSLIEKVMESRAHKPLTLIDIAVPRDIEPNVTQVQSVSLYCIDALMTIIENNRQGREHAAQKARELIKIKSRELGRDLMSHDKVSHTIRAYRGQIEDICHMELSKAKLQLSQGIDPEQVLDMFAYAFTKKLLHTPSVQIRQAGAEGRFDLLSFAKQLFAIPDPKTE